MPAPHDSAKPLDLYFDVRLQSRFIAEGKITHEDVVKRTLAGPDVAGNSVHSASASAESGPRDPAPARAPRPSRIKAAPQG